MNNFDLNIKKYGNENNVPITLDDTLSFICKTINENNSKQILEIGTAIAYGSISMAENTNCAHIDTLEINEDRYILANKNIAEHNLENKITCYLTDAIEYLKNCNKKYDFIYLDGPKGQYIKYLTYLVKILNKGGIIIADNLNFHGMVTGEIPVSRGCRSMIKGLKNYIEEISNNPIFETKILNIGDGIGITRLK